MYKLYVDKNELFEANIQLEGASLDETFARLIVETDKWNLVFEGTIDRKGNVEIPIRKLKNIFSSNTKGELKLEVIADDTYFTPWNDSFELLRSKNVTVEVKENKKDIIKESTPKVSVKTKNDRKRFKLTESIAKTYLMEVIVAISKNGNYKNTIKETTNEFVKQYDLGEGSHKKLYKLVKESKEVIENAVRNIR